jgi:hypothetical protein
MRYKNIFDLIGEVQKKNKNISETDKGVYTIYSDYDLKRITEEIEIKNNIGPNKNVYEVFKITKNHPTHGELYHPIGYLLMKDDKPHILSYCPGDDYGAVVFNNSFIVSGHDGSYLFNIDNPLDFLRHTK